MGKSRGRATPYVMIVGGALMLHQRGYPPTEVGSEEWYRLVAATDSADRVVRVFYYQDGGDRSFTARREARRGKLYWYAYRKHQGRLQKVYVGLPGDLSMLRLVAVAIELDNRVWCAVVDRKYGESG